MNEPTSTSPGLLRTLRTVASAMIGVRGRKHHDEDAALSPLLVAVVALIFMAVFVGVLVTLAMTIVAK